MNVRAADLPSSRSLALGLRAAMKRAAAGDPEDFEVVSRQMSRMSSSFPAEIVTCRLPSLGLIRLLIKYGVGHEASGYGHRGGVAYEGEVYERVLAHARSSTVTVLGAAATVEGAVAWLLLEYLESATRINMSRRPFDAMVGAARWIGGFHAETTALHQRRSWTSSTRTTRSISLDGRVAPPSSPGPGLPSFPGYRVHAQDSRKRRPHSLMSHPRS